MFTGERCLAPYMASFACASSLRYFGNIQSNNASNKGSIVVEWMRARAHYKGTARVQPVFAASLGLLHSIWAGDKKKLRLLELRYSQDDGHTLCLMSQAAAEVTTFLSACQRLYKAVGFRKGDVAYRLSTR